MPVSNDTRQALKLLERIQLHLKESEAACLSPSVGDDLNTLISVLDSPVLNSILNVQDSLQELKKQLNKHPSILPVDFDISPITGELILNIPSDPIPVHNSDSYEPSSDNEQNYEPEDRDKKPRIGLKPVEVESKVSEKSTSDVAPPDYALSAITTDSYAEEFQRTIDQGAQGREIHNLQLFKPEGSSLGFSVVGLRSEQKGELGIFVQEIQPTGIAGRDGRLSEGDQILAIDGQPLDSNISHQQAIGILQQARGLVELIVARGGIPPDNPPATPSQAADMVLSTEWSLVECVELVNDGSGLGFGIIGGRSTGVVVKTILPGGVADRDGRLQSGDHILQIGDVNLRGMGSEQVATVLRGSGSRVRLVVARPAPTDDHAPSAHPSALFPTRALADAERVERHLALARGSGEPLPYKGEREEEEFFVYRREIDDVDGSAMCGGAAAVAPAEAVGLPEMESFEVELVKDQQGLGITIAGYVCEKEEISGIFVKSIAKGSAADMCGQIRVNDQIIEVDGRSLHGYTNHDAVEVLRSTGKAVKLRLARYLRGAKYQQLQLAIASGELSYPSLPALAQVHDSKILTIDAANHDIDIDNINILIDDDYISPLSPRVEAAIQSRWNKIMGPEYEIVVAQLSKFREGGGLGISLEGTVDVEDGKEVRPHHYIRSILPDGPVGVNSFLQGGDELLEVNGEKLLGMNHLGVVATLKDLPIHVRIVCARRLLTADLETSPSSQQAEYVHPYHVDYDLSTVPEFCGPGVNPSRSLLSGPFGGSLTSLSLSSERLVKAKSDGSLAVGTSATSSPPMEVAMSKLKSRSLEPLTGLAMWSSEPQVIELVKGDRGLGFSILDYQDPMNPNETVIVIRSLVPGGVAQQDGRLIPGDRLLFVNDMNLENASLDAAVQALKGALKGVVRIGVAKPLPLPESSQGGQIPLDSSPRGSELLHHMPSFELPPRFSLNLDFEQKLNSQEGERQLLLPSGLEVWNYCQTPFEVSSSKSIGISKDDDGLGSKVYSGGGAIEKVPLADPVPVPVPLLKMELQEEISDADLNDGPSEVSQHSTTSSSDDRSFVSARTTQRSGEDEDEFFDPTSPRHRDSPAKQDAEATTGHPSVTPVKRDSIPNSPLKPSEGPKASPPAIASIGKVKVPSVFQVRSPKPTVPFKPIRTSLSPKDILPARVKSKPLSTEGESNVARQWGCERAVELRRDPTKGLGISIISGKADCAGIFVKSVLPDSPAGWNGTLKRGDRILEVGGVDIRSASHAKAVEVIKNATNPVKFLIQSLVPMPKNLDLKTVEPETSVTKQEIFPMDKTQTKMDVPEILKLSRTEAAVTKTSPAIAACLPLLLPKSPSAAAPSVVPTSHKSLRTPDEAGIVVTNDDDKHEDEEAADQVVVPLVKGKAITKKGKMIDSSSAGNVKWSIAERSADPDEEDEFGYTPKKIEKRYGELKGSVVVVEVVKGSNKLGLSLAGNRDRTKMSVFVCGMHPAGLARRDGRIRIGDELLEVNGVVVYGRCHLNASAMIKGLSGTTYKIVLLRREGSIEEMAVKPLSQFPSELDEEAAEDKYCHYRGMHTVTVRKGAHGLGIMIIEGKHAEVGQGIFISDIQENSAAEQAGLNVGDMILAANATDMVGADFDTAASILKQAEGLITLIVANPNKPSPGFLYEDDKGYDEIIERSQEKNMTIKACEKKERSAPPLPPPKPSHLLNKSPSTNSTTNNDDSATVNSAPEPPPPNPTHAEEGGDPDDLSFQEERRADPKRCDIRSGRETTVEIVKEKIGLGLSIVGGSDTPLGAVIIHEIYPDGAAALDGRLRPGDQILEVNGEDLREAQHEHAIAALRQTPAVVQMLVYREEGHAHEEEATEVLEVELQKKQGKGLGLSIVGRKNGPGVFISEVVKGGVAEADGRLIQGDQILEVNSQDLKMATQEHAAAVLKTTMGKIHMKIGRLKAGSRRSTSCLTTTPKNQESIDSSALKTVTLERGAAGGLGFSVVGGRDSPHGDLPICVKGVFEKGAAEGRLAKGDQILTVNGRSLAGLTHEAAVRLIQEAEGSVTLRVLCDQVVVKKS